MIILKRKVLLPIILLFFSTLIYGQEEIKELPSGYLMTIAAYNASGENYAIRYTEELNKKGFDVNYGFTFKKNMYFVYVKHYSDFKEAISEIISTRQNTPFNDAWVYVYDAVNLKPIDETAQKIEEVKEIEKTEKIKEISEAPPMIKKDTLITEINRDTIVAKIIPPKEIIPDGSRIVRIEALHARTLEPVDIEFTMYDPYSQNTLVKVRSLEAKRVLPPENKDHTVRVTNNTIGWHKDEVGFNFDNPVTDSTKYFTKIDNDTLILFFEMHRLRRGDFQTLYNVYFFNESSIMRPESQFQLNELLNMLEEDSGYRIKLHGHTNGSASGDYVRLAENDTLFFKMSRIHERTKGSAKDLSYDRAMTVKLYLVSKGIAENRIEVIGWGGKKMIYDQHSKAAKRNIRVEVEVLDVTE